MATSTYGDALARVLTHESGYSNHPSDPGGPTNFGITLADYRRYVKPGATAADVRAMKVDEAKAIYRSKYWDAMRCDELPAGVDYAVFDYGVNSGIRRAAKVLQRVVGVADDGDIGPATLAAAKSGKANGIVAAICDERLIFLKSLKTWPVFGKGWSRRVSEVRDAALAMVAAAPSRSVTAPTAGKGVVPRNALAQKGAAAASIVAGAATAQQAHASGVGLAGIAAIVVVAIAIGAGGWLFWHWRQQHQQQARRAP